MLPPIQYIIKAWFHENAGWLILARFVETPKIFQYISTNLANILAGISTYYDTQSKETFEKNVNLLVITWLTVTTLLLFNKLTSFHRVITRNIWFCVLSKPITWFLYRPPTRKIVALLSQLQPCEVTHLVRCVDDGSSLNVCISICYFLMLKFKSYAIDLISIINY